MTDRDGGSLFQLDQWPDLGQIALQQTVEFNRQIAEGLLSAGLDLEQPGSEGSDLRGVTEQSDFAVVLQWTDEDGWPIVEASENVESVLGYDPAALTADSIGLLDLVHEEDVEAVRSDVEAIDESNDAYRLEPFRLQQANEGIRWVKGYATIHDEDDDGRTYVGYLVDITAQKEIETRLETQRNTLEMLNRVLRHDIRNDLQLIQTYAGLLEDHVDDDGETYVENIQQSVDQAVDLTDTTGDLADVMLQSRSDRQPVSVRDCLMEEVETVRSTYPDAAVRIEDDLPETEVVANEMLGTVFRNILTNAIKHNDKDQPAVDIEGDINAQTVTVRIADNGPGVPDERKGDIFGKGEKGQESEGTGTGLYLVSSLVDRYGGDVRAEDNEPTGTVVVVTLPRAD
jgi:PAS domain S-box-containing protein